MIRSNIFGLPSLIAAHLGKLSLAGYLVAFAGVAVIAACLAEVASQFQEAGGPCMRQLFSLPDISLTPQKSASGKFEMRRMLRSLTSDGNSEVET